MQTHLSINSASQKVRVSLSFLVCGKGYDTKGNVCSTLGRQWEGKKTLSVESQLPSVQTNLYVKVAHNWMAYPDPLHMLLVFNEYS